MNSLHQPGARHCADVAGAFSPGWFEFGHRLFAGGTRKNGKSQLIAELRQQVYDEIVKQFPLWSRAHMSANTRARLVRWLLGGYARA